MAVLHILNGSAVRPSLEASGLDLSPPNDVVVWREMLCEGPTLPEVDQPGSIEVRARFLADHMAGEVDERSYQQRWSPEMHRLLTFAGREVVLWFEYDLFCQINLLAALHLISLRHPRKAVSLVCTGLSSAGQWTTLGMVPPAEWQKLYMRRQPLDADVIDFGSLVWQTYCSDSHGDLMHLIQQCPSVLLDLGPALHRHLQRFPSRLDGLTVLERYVLRRLISGPVESGAFLGELVRVFHDYGYGDLQWKALLQSMHPAVQLLDYGYGLRNGIPSTWSVRSMIYGGASTQSVHIEDLI